MVSVHALPHHFPKDNFSSRTRFVWVAECIHHYGGDLPDHGGWLDVGESVEGEEGLHQIDARPYIV